MSIKNQIIVASREHFKSHIRKHLTNINVMLANPVTIPDHTDVMDAIEKELEIVAEYDDKLSMLEKYLAEEPMPTAKSNGQGNGNGNGNQGNNDDSSSTSTVKETTTKETTQQDTAVYTGAGSHVTIERPFTV